MAVLVVIVLWLIVSVMAALSLGRFFSMTNEPVPKPVPVRHVQLAYSDMRPSAPGLDEGGGSHAEAA